MRLFALLLVAAFLTCAAPSSAQSPDDPWLPTFVVPGTHGIDTVIKALVRDGESVYVGGHFDVIDDVEAASVARWNGSAWEPLGGGLSREFGDATVHALAVAPDGSLYAAGRFTHAIQSDGTEIEAHGIAHWTGSMWEPLGQGVTHFNTLGYVNALALHDGDLVVGGLIDGARNADGSTLSINHMVRWNGIAWEPSVGTDGEVFALAVDAEGGLVFGGDFDEVVLPSGASFSARNLARWHDGAWEPLGDGAGSQPVQALLASGTDLFVGGRFTTVYQTGGTPLGVNRIARWDGSQWHALGAGTDGPVRALAATVEGEIYAGGDFETVFNGASSVESRALARWDGMTWHAADGLDPFAEVHVLLALDDGSAVAGGDFYRIGAGETALIVHDLVRHRAADASPWHLLSARSSSQGLSSVAPYSSDRSVYDLTRLPCDGDLLLGGTIDQAGAAAVTGLARWNGTAWASAGEFLGDGFEPYARVLEAGACIDGQDAFYVAGLLAQVRQPDQTLLTVNRAAYWDGTQWYNLGAGGPAIISVLQATPDGVYAADRDGGPVRFWSTSTQTWTTVAAGVEGPIHAMAVAEDGPLYVGGNFPGAAQPDGTYLFRPHLVYWDGTRWVDVGAPNGIPYTMTFGPDGALYVGGAFGGVTNVDGTVVPARNVARLEGTTWTALGDGLPSDVLDLHVTEAGIPFAATGRYTGNGTGRVSWWDGTGWHTLAQTESDVHALTEGTDGILYVGGEFSIIGGMGSPYLAAASIPAVLPVEPDRPDLGTPLALQGAAPNPFRDHVTLTFMLAEPGSARMAVYDLLGREVALLASGVHPAGRHEVRFDARRFPSGVYLIRLDAAGRSATRTITLVR